MRRQKINQPKPPDESPARVSYRRRWLICVLLTLVTVALYWPVRHYEFVNYDDLDGIAKSPTIRGGLSWSNVAWAFQNRHMGNWQPLTSLSHMADCQFFGLNAG